MKVLLICSNGISSSLVVSRMKNYATANQIDIEIKADNEDNLPYIYSNYDIILIAPQLAHHMERIKNTYIGTGITIAPIPSTDYGMANGRNLVQYVLNLYEEGHKNGQYTYENEMLQMISLAGQAKQQAYEAMTWVEKKQYSKAEQTIKSANKALMQAHQIQSTVIASVMQNENQNVSILMVHAQDQVASAETAIELITHMIRIFRKQ